MHRIILRKVGGSVTLAVPPAILEMMDLQAGSIVSLAVEQGRMVVAPIARLRYSLAGLLAESACSLPQPTEERDWIDAPATGRESI